MASELSKSIEEKLRVHSVLQDVEMHLPQSASLPCNQDAAASKQWSNGMKVALFVFLALLGVNLIVPSYRSGPITIRGWQGAGTHGAQQTTASKAGAITPPRIAFVSAIIGGYERTTKPVANQTVPVDCIVYSDRADLETHGIWRIIDTERYRLGINATDASPAYNNSLSNNTHTFNRAKFFKLNLHRLPELAQYDIVVWLDGTVEVTSPNAAATLVWLLRARGAAIVTFDHPHRIYWTDEVVVSTRSHKYTSTSLWNQTQPFQDVSYQAAAALADGFDPTWQWSVAPQDPRYQHFPVPLSQVFLTCLVAFDMRRPESRTFLDEWYRQHLLYTTQDQVGFPIAMWKVQVLPWTLGQIKQSSLVVKHNHGERR